MNTVSAVAVASLLLSGCASSAEQTPEPETPVRLRIEDQSAWATPPAPPSAPPSDADAAASDPRAPRPAPSATPTVPTAAAPVPPLSPPTAAAPVAPPSPAPAAAAPAPAPSPSPPAAAAPAPPPSPPAAATPAAPQAASVPPSTVHWAYEYPTGRWVYANEYGWMWIPANTATELSDGIPYVYLYTPSYGWTWYVSPWGRGPYHYGVWVRRPWHPVGWHGAWVAHPRVVVRLGAPGPRYYHSHRRHGW